MTRQQKASVTAFWRKVDKSGDCWLWTGLLDPSGYGIHGRGEAFPRRAHRMAFMLSTGRRPESHEYILHSCDTPSCVNPAHLRVGDAAANAADARERCRFHTGDAHWSRRMPERRARGEAQGASKATADDVAMIHAAKASGASLYALAKHMPISYGQVKRIASGKCWRHSRAGSEAGIDLAGGARG